MTDQPWPEAPHGKPITETWLARRLRSFRISPHTLRIDEDRQKGTNWPTSKTHWAVTPPVAGLLKRDAVTKQAGVDGMSFQKRDNAAACHASITHETPETIGLSRCHDSNLPAAEKQLVEADLL